MNGIRKYYFKKGPPPPNFFVGGVGSFMTGTTQVASELGVSFYKVKSFSATTNDIQFHIPSSFVQPQLKWNSTSMVNNLTYWYDVGGNVTQINQDCFDSCSKLERIWIPNCTHIAAPSGYHTLRNTIIKGFVEVPKWDGLGGNSNFIFNGSNITHLKYPAMVRAALQWTNASQRYSHQNITTLKRVYLPVLTSVITHEGTLYDYRFINNIPANTVVYLPPYMETARNAERYVQMNNVLSGDTLTLNGLTYTATDGATTSTEFNCTVSNLATAKNLSTSINADARVGTLGDLTTRYSHNNNFIVIKQTLTGVTGNATTYSSSNPARFITPAGSTFYSGGTMERTVYYWKVIRGAEIRYITGTTTPDAVVDLSGTNVTSTTIDLVFTPPASPDRPIDFYEVWIDDGFYTGSTIWQSYVPHQEIAGSGSTVTDLQPATTYTFRVKAADTLYNVSDFSNTFTGTTL